MNENKSLIQLAKFFLKGISCSLRGELGEEIEEKTADHTGKCSDT